MPDHNLAVLPLAYVGPGMGIEFIPYLLGLLAWAGLAVGAIFLRPFFALIRLFKVRKKEAAGSAEDASAEVAPDGLEATTLEGRTRPKHEVELNQDA
ncbi:MAG: hypothetical protein FJ271_11650 [Planctomycetes bacterium]|nr:hypothetical protein [Planctomycetota bacterium]